MQRRDLLFTGAATALTHAALNLGCGTHSARAGGEGTTPASTDSGARAALSKAAAECVSVGEACLSHCLQLLSRGDTSIAACAVAVRTMLAVCEATGTLASTDSALLSAQAKVCQAACEQCAEACSAHAGHHAECKACLEACKRAIAAVAALG